ncbi:MAG: NAD-dependent epimerase/dehydratase family protein [Actinobacteria bacterium]|nr:NAD-dependent epimerase/dehydratase family protein [Actinomycetota bacterium]
MRALVLGGSAFIGRQLVDTLLHRGHTVTVLNRGLTPHDLPDDVERLVANRLDHSSMVDALAGRDWDAVFDVSGYVMAAGGSDTEALFDLFDGRTAHYVYVSSIMAYEQSMRGIAPWMEDYPTDRSGPNTYGGFKANVEAQLMARFERRQFPATVVRPAAVYGPRNNVFDMETPMFLRLLQGRPILLPHSGLVTASYGHVADLADAMLAIVGNRTAVGEVFNVTAGAVTTRRYVEILARVVGREPNIVPVSDERLHELPPGAYGHLFSDRHHAVLSIDKARHLLGFEPRFDIRAGHADTYQWFLSRGYDRLEGPLSDPVWRATWNFDAEAAAAGILRGLATTGA